MDSELYIELYIEGFIWFYLLWQKQTWWGVACYIKKESNYNIRGNCPTNFENIFLDLLLPNSKPILIGIIYRLPDQSGFLDMVSSAIADMEDFDNQEDYILGDLNFNLVDKSKYILDTKYSKVMVPWDRLKQHIRSPTRVAKTTSTLLDHILINANELE